MIYIYKSNNNNNFNVVLIKISSVLYCDVISLKIWYHNRVGGMTIYDIRKGRCQTTTKFKWCDYRGLIRQERAEVSLSNFWASFINFKTNIIYIAFTSFKTLWSNILWQWWRICSYFYLYLYIIKIKKEEGELEISHNKIVWKPL